MRIFYHTTQTEYWFNLMLLSCADIFWGPVYSACFCCLLCYFCFCFCFVFPKCCDDKDRDCPAGTLKAIQPISPSFPKKKKKNEEKERKKIQNNDDNNNNNDKKN